MKKRLLALLLALVLAFSMLPTAFATDAVEPAEGLSAGAAEGKTPTEGETEEKPAEEPAEPEQPEEPGEAEEPEQPDEEAPEEAAEAATFAADASGVEAYLMGERLKNGYYTTRMISSGESTFLSMVSRSDTKPVGRNNYLYYKDGTLTVTGELLAYNDPNHDWTAVLTVYSGKLTVNGEGCLTLSGENMVALLVKDGAEIDFNFTPYEDVYSRKQLTIQSTDAVAVQGDLTISNAGHVLIQTDSGSSSYNTVDGDALLKAMRIDLYNASNGACVNGNLDVDVGYMSILNQSETTAALIGGTRAYNLKADDMQLKNYCGAVVDGDIKITTDKAREDEPLFGITGCTTGDTPVVNGDITVSNGRFHITNMNCISADEEELYEKYKDYHADGPILKGNLTLINLIDFGMNRPLDKPETTMIQGSIQMIDCNAEEDHVFHIYRDGTGAAIDGNITLKNSKLAIYAGADNGEIYKDAGILNCNLTMEDSMFYVYGWNNDWKSVNIRDEYEWYAGEYPFGAIRYIKSSQKVYTPSESSNVPYLKIRCGNKVGEAQDHSATVTSDVDIEGKVGQQIEAWVAIRLTGDTLDLQNVEGYTEIAHYADGTKKYGVPSYVDLTQYFTLETPAGGSWRIRGKYDLEQDGSVMELLISGTPTIACSGEELMLTISGDILSTGVDLPVDVTARNSVCWEIEPSEAGGDEIDYTNIRTASQFAQAVGGDKFAKVEGTKVTLLDNVTPLRGIVMTGKFTVDLNGHNIYNESLFLNGAAILYSESGHQIIMDSAFKGEGTAGYLNNGICLVGGEVMLENIDVFSVRVEKGILFAKDAAFLGVRNVSGTVALENVLFRDCYIDGGTTKLTNCTSEPKEGVNVKKNIVVSGGSLEIFGGSFKGSLDGGLCLYQSGGKVTIENAELFSQPVKMAGADGEEKPTQHCIELNGGELEIRDTTVGGAIYMYNKAQLRLLDESVIRTVNAAALYAGGGSATILNSTIEPAGVNNMAVYVGDGASVSMDGGELVGYNAGVTIGKGGSFTLKGGRISSASKGIWLPDSKGKLTVTGGEVASPEVAIYAESGNSISLAGGEFMGGMNAMFIHNGTMKNWLAKDCEMEGDSLSENFDPAKEFQTGAGTVKIVAADYVAKANKANAVMEKVPSDTSKIKKDDLDAIVAAEEACDEASRDKNVKKYLDKNLIKRVKAARKAYDKNEKAANKVQAMIDALPDVPELEYARHRKAVDKAEKAFDKLTPAQRTFLTQDTDEAPGAESKLDACIKRIRTLENYEQTIKTAQAAFKKIPEWSKLKKSDESKVEAARKAMDALLEQEEAAKGFIIPENDPNRQKCVASIKAYDRFKEIADEYRETYLNDLPSGNNVSKDNAEKIRDARDAYDNLGKTEYPGATKNIQSFIDKKELTKLKNLEKQLAKNEKAALKVTKLIEKLLDYKAPFDSKQAKAIDAAWKAYEKLGSDAVRSFVEHAETLNWCYERLHTPLAYVGKGLDVAGAELAEDDGENYTLTIWVGGTETSVYVTKADAQKYFTENFKAGFYAFQRVEIGGVTVMQVVTAPGGFENRFLNQPNECYFNGTIIKIGTETYPLADNCVLYGIRDGKVEKIDASDFYESDSTRQVYVDLNSQSLATAIYAVLGAND